MKFFDYDLTLEIEGIDFLSKRNERPIVVSCLNPHSFVKAENDSVFKEALQHSDYLLPDGVGICMEVHRWGGRQIKKIAGDDFHKYILEQLKEKGGKVFYMGSTEKVLSGIRERLQKDYPNIEVKTHSPSFSSRMSEKEASAIIAEIESFAPDALWIGLGAPKQEKWVYDNLAKLHTPRLVASIGGAFEFFAGTIKRAPQWAINMHAEWLFRFIKEPFRMWERNMVSTPKYLLYVRKHHDKIM